MKCYLLICQEKRETAIIDAGANPEAIIKKAHGLNVRPSKILLTFPDHYRLFPGHGPAISVGEEKQHNPFFFGRVTN